MKHKIVFFDRDSTLVHDTCPSGLPLQIFDEAKIALDLLREAGFEFILVSNQPWVSRGLLTEAQIREQNYQLDLKIGPFLSLDFCPHDDKDGCQCRKPLPGMILRHAHITDFSRSWMVGDKQKDVEAGKAAGLKTVRVGMKEDPGTSNPATAYAENVWEAANKILALDVSLS